MRTDPRAACKNADQRLLWALVHDAIAHPFMAITGYSRLSLRFHDFTSYKAWPREQEMKVSYWNHGLWSCEAEGLISLAKTPDEAVERWKAFKASMERT